MSGIHTAEIIAVGSELLTPHRIDTNSLFLTGRLNNLGIVVGAKAIVGDDRDALAGIVRAALSRADVVITTGGLGPTADDVTREVVANVLGLTLVEDPAIVETIRQRFDRRGIRMPEINRRQAMIPTGAVVLPNGNGTAPGLILEGHGKVAILLPGPPRELQPMFDGQVAPHLEARAGGRRLVKRVLKITGRSESQVEEASFPIYSKLGRSGATVETTILASPGQIELHLSAAGNETAELNRMLDDGVRALEDALGPVVFSTDGRSLEAVVGDALREQKKTIAVAESCTGGTVLGRLTDVPGSSAWVVGGVVAYDDRIKIDELGVDAAAIRSLGAVSEPVACAMAEGVRSRFRTDIGVGVTGIAGPGGGTPEKPVGTVFVAVAAAETTARVFTFHGDREMVRRFSTSAALDMVRRALALGT